MDSIIIGLDMVICSTSFLQQLHVVPSCKLLWLRLHLTESQHAGTHFRQSTAIKITKQPKVSVEVRPCFLHQVYIHPIKVCWALNSMSSANPNQAATIRKMVFLAFQNEDSGFLKLHQSQQRHQCKAAQGLSRPHKEYLFLSQMSPFLFCKMPTKVPYQTLGKSKKSILDTF